MNFGLGDVMTALVLAACGGDVVVDRVTDRDGGQGSGGAATSTGGFGSLSTSSVGNGGSDGGACVASCNEGIHSGAQVCSDAGIEPYFVYGQVYGCGCNIGEPCLPACEGSLCMSQPISGACTSCLDQDCVGFWTKCTDN